MRQDIVISIVGVIIMVTAMVAVFKFESSHAEDAPKVKSEPLQRGAINTTITINCANKWNLDVERPYGSNSTAMYDLLGEALAGCLDDLGYR